MIYKVLALVLGFTFLIGGYIYIAKTEVRDADENSKTDAL